MPSDDETAQVAAIGSGPVDPLPGQVVEASRVKQILLLAQTIHLAIDPSRLTVEALEEVDLLMVECLPGGELPRWPIELTAQGLCPDSLVEQVRAAALRLGLHDGDVLDTPPWMAGAILVQAAFNERWSMDMRLMELAHRRGVRCQGLETAGELLHQVGAIDLEWQLRSLEAVLAWLDEGPLAWWRTRLGIGGWWSRATEPLPPELPLPLHLHLVAARNRAWVPRMISSCSEKPVLVAAGAGHMYGVDGLPALLAREGFTLRLYEGDPPGRDPNSACGNDQGYGRRRSSEAPSRRAKSRLAKAFPQSLMVDRGGVGAPPAPTPFVARSTTGTPPERARSLSGAESPWPELTLEELRRFPIYGYFGSGLDFTPLVTDRPDNPTGYRFHGVCLEGGIKGTVRLWMTDCAPCCPRRLKSLYWTGERMSIMASGSDSGSTRWSGARLALWRRLGVTDVTVKVNRLHCLAPELRTAVRAGPSEMARRRSSGRGRRPTLPSWDVAQLALEVWRRGCGSRPDRYEAWWSPFEGLRFLRHVLGPARVQLMVVAVLVGSGDGFASPGWWACNLRGAGFGAALADLSGVLGGPDYVLQDETFPVRWRMPMRRTGHRLGGWGYGDVGLYRVGGRCTVPTGGHQ